MLWVDELTTINRYSMSILGNDWMLGNPPRDCTKDTLEYFRINPHNQPQDCMSPEKAASYLETKRSFQGTMIRKISLLSYAMRGDYTFKPLAYEFHHICVQLVDLTEYPSAKYVGKDKSHETGLINLWPSSSGQLIDPRPFQQDIHTPGTQKTIWQTNFLKICLIYRLCQNQEQSC